MPKKGWQEGLLDSCAFGAQLVWPLSVKSWLHPCSGVDLDKIRAVQTCFHSVTQHLFCNWTISEW